MFGLSTHDQTCYGRHDGDDDRRIVGDPEQRLAGVLLGHQQAQYDTQHDGAGNVHGAILQDDGLIVREYGGAFLKSIPDQVRSLSLQHTENMRAHRGVGLGGGDVIMRSRLDVWQIPQNVYRRMPVSYAELAEKVYPCGKIGRYFVEQLVEHNAATRPSAMPYRSLGDSPCVA